MFRLPTASSAIPYHSDRFETIARFSIRSKLLDEDSQNEDRPLLVGAHATTKEIPAQWEASPTTQELPAQREASRSSPQYIRAWYIMVLYLRPLLPQF